MASKRTLLDRTINSMTPGVFKDTTQRNKGAMGMIKNEAMMKKQKSMRQLEMKKKEMQEQGSTVDQLLLKAKVA